MVINTETVKDSSYLEYADIPRQLMLTERKTCQYRSCHTVPGKQSRRYIFNVRDQTYTLEAAVEASIRRVIANHVLDEVLTENKFEIQQEIKEDL